MTGQSGNRSGGVTLIGGGFVADLYMRSLRTFPDLPVHGVHDRDPERLRAFTGHWSLPGFQSLEAAIAATPPDGVILNLTNPASHAEVSRTALAARRHVWSEKPLALTMAEARELAELALSRGVQIASAPASVLGEAAQTLIRAVRAGTAGTPRLAYAELDDGFIPQAPLDAWQSESGAPWPWQDEFDTGCTLEHAGYYLSWLIALFGPVTSLTAASAALLPDKRGYTGGTPDFSTATLFFTGGMAARLTCSIIAPHDHRIRVIGDAGVLQVDRAWDNAAPVRFRKRMTVRRRLMEHPLGRRIKPEGKGHPKVSRKGAAAMNFALGPVEMLRAIAAGRESRLAGAYALHLNEVTLAIQNAGRGGADIRLTTTCAPMEPMEW